MLFRFGGISWIMGEDERVPDRFAMPVGLFRFNNFRSRGCRDLDPASRRVRWAEFDSFY